MAKRNDYDGSCSVCGAPVNANEGTMIYDPDLILCVEQSPKGSFESPAPPEASKLPSIHRGEDKYER